MSDTIAPTLLDIGGLPRSMQVQEALVLLWAEDEAQAKAAVEVLCHGLWPYYYLFHVVEVRRISVGGPCPLRTGESPALASMRRERFAWVLVPPGTQVEAVISCESPDQPRKKML